MSISSGQTHLPLEISICVMDWLVEDRDHRTLMVCSLVCHPRRCFTKQNPLISKLLASAAQSPEARAATFAYIRTVNFPGLPRLLHIYPPTGENLQYANTVGEILTAIPQFTSLCLGPIHWPPDMTLRKTTISQMNLDSVVMMDLSMLVQVISNLEALESLRLNLFLTAKTLQLFKASRILSPHVWLPNLFPSHGHLRSVTLLVKRYCSPPELFWNRKPLSYTILTFNLSRDQGTEDV
ncbi:hypothetical protein B0H14DRAFT_2773678 [Mycena olivaceomarginata]|nr:hypothetical protein B0H14DRAFT_2773678 [Mycena olivaceomarginata]